MALLKLFAKVFTGTKYSFLGISIFLDEFYNILLYNGYYALMGTYGDFEDNLERISENKFCFIFEYMTIYRNLFASVYGYFH